MGKPVDEPRKVFVGIRLTEKEEISLRGQMDAVGYNSLSRYVRERALADRRVFRSNAPVTGREVRDRLNVVSSTVSQAGLDCSRFARQFDGLMEGFAKCADPERHSRTALRNMRSMVRSMKDIQEGVDKLLDLFLKIESTADSRMESSSITINSKEDMLQKIEIIGFIAKDAELRTGRDGSQFMTFSVKCSEDYGEERRVTYYDVSKSYTKVMDYLKKGRKVYVSGKLSLSQYEKDGKVWMNNRVKATDIQLLDSREEAEMAQEA